MAEAKEETGYLLKQGVDKIQSWWNSEEGVMFRDPERGLVVGLCYLGGQHKKYCLVINGKKFDDMTLLMARMTARHIWENSEVK